MNEDRRAEIKMWANIHEDLPDGAFLAIMAEHGIEPEEIADAYTPDERKEGD